MTRGCEIIRKRAYIILFIVIAISILALLIGEHRERSAEEKFLSEALTAYINKSDSIKFFADNSFISEADDLPRYTEFKIREVQPAGDNYNARKAIVDFRAKGLQKISTHVITMQQINNKWLMVAID